MTSPPIKLIENSLHLGQVLSYNVSYSTDEFTEDKEYTLEILVPGLRDNDLTVAMHEQQIKICSFLPGGYPLPSFLDRNFESTKRYIESSFKLLTGYEIKKVELDLGLLKIHIGRANNGPIAYNISSPTSKKYPHLLNEDSTF